MSDLPKRLRIKAGMIQLGEKIAWGSDTELMYEAADRIETLESNLEAEREKVRVLRVALDEISAKALQATAPELEGE